MAVTTCWPNVQIETSESNLRKVSELFKTLQSGELDGQVIRPAMKVGDIVKAIGVSRKTFYEWKEGTSMPQPGNLRSIALNLLHVQEADLANYFAGTLAIKDLLTIRVKVATPDDVLQTFQLLRSDREKDAVLAQLLQDRAKKLGNDAEPQGADTTSPILIGKNSKSGITTVYQFEYLVFNRLKNLMDASREQMGLSEIQYVRSAASNGIALEEASLFYEDVMDGTYNRSHTRTRIEAFLPLLFRIKNPRTGLSLDTSRTYTGNFEGLIRDLERLGNGAAQQPIHYGN
ncbi:hypothetical protein [Allocoleopsis sp.]|uniref:hypothetical protein n=1 Tax=Allocoleopsis sp. TaxID=3088169 RepID=UPI002FD4381B